MVDEVIVLYEVLEMLDGTVDELVRTVEEGVEKLEKLVDVEL